MLLVITFSSNSKCKLKIFSSNLIFFYLIIVCKSSFLLMKYMTLGRFKMFKGIIRVTFWCSN